MSSCMTNYITHFYLQPILANFIIVYTSQNRLITTNREYFLFSLTYLHFGKHDVIIFLS